MRLDTSVDKRARNMARSRGFILDMNLVDVPCVGGRFSWFNGKGNAMSRLDLFLLSQKLIDEWGVINQRIGLRDVSDHFPITINTSNINWGPNSFRFNNMWLRHDNFSPFVKDEWEKISMAGRGDFVLYEKLKRLKSILRGWNCDGFGWVDLRVNEKVKELNDLDGNLVENHGDNIDELAKVRSNMMGDLWKTLNIKEGMLRPKSRQR
ncbi:uncharacterized protein LOC131614440 [Vicia villosa]|uniref:uncharacterized protein LOC131614440 n=1 Tax=Vicia villosa TaxID=3911 RepID=UPI00273A92B4|nr:uncharacterized protein LOC131614440 [Vicia villosa]